MLRQNKIVNVLPYQSAGCNMLNDEMLQKIERAMSTYYSNS